MPTVYTDKIGENVTFKEFALVCSRAFLFHLRDEKISSTVTKKIPSTHYKDSLKEAEDDIKDFNLKTNEEIIVQIEQSYLEKRKEYNERIDKKKKLNILCTNMYNKVLEYEPPTSKHDGLKTFMLEQLSSTIDHDCSMDNINPPIKQGLENYKKTMLSMYHDDIKYYKKCMKKENDDCVETNLWIDQLIESLE